MVPAKDGIFGIRGESHPHRQFSFNNLARNSDLVGQFRVMRRRIGVGSYGSERLSSARSHCPGGRAIHAMTYEADELRRTWRKCSCPIYASGTLGGASTPFVSPAGAEVDAPNSRCENIKCRHRQRHRLSRRGSMLEEQARPNQSMLMSMSVFDGTRVGYRLK